MNDLNTLMRDQARAGLQTQLDAAVTGGDTEAARKITDQIAALAVQTAPKSLPYGDVEIRTHLDKQPWFGTDPKRSAKAIEFGKTMDPKKFATAEAFAAAIVKAVDDEFKSSSSAPPKKEDEDEDDEDDEEDQEDEDEDDEEENKKKPPPKKRRTDGDAETSGRSSSSRRASGPWLKLADAPKEVQAEIKRATAKFVHQSASKEIRDAYVKRSLESHYAVHQRQSKGK
jgi:hypothetical protein